MHRKIPVFFILLIEDAKGGLAIDATTEHVTKWNSSGFTVWLALILPTAVLIRQATNGVISQGRNDAKGITGDLHVVIHMMIARPYLRKQRVHETAEATL